MISLYTFQSNLHCTSVQSVLLFTEKNKPFYKMTCEMFYIENRIIFNYYEHTVIERIQVDLEVLLFPANSRSIYKHFKTIFIFRTSPFCISKLDELSSGFKTESIMLLLETDE